MGKLIFSTAFGPCVLEYGSAGVTRIALRRGRAPAKRADEDVPRFVRAAARRIALHLSGHPQDLRAVPLDLSLVPPFHRRVYEVARRVRSGQTITYGELAARVGSPGAARSVGQAMARNPFLIVVPCHRVLGAGARLGGFSAPGGVKTKARLLELEGSRQRA